MAGCIEMYLWAWTIHGNKFGQWMYAHPDGRAVIGYRTGAYLVKKAMKRSGKDNFEISKMSVKAIYKLAGY
jgi:hypothetical protein